MSKLRSTGRMIRRDLSEDPGVNRLSDGAFRLYVHLTTYLDFHGKFSGGPGTISETVVPLLRWSRKKILAYLVEINLHTSMRIWTQFGRFAVQDLRFHEVQEIRTDRRGRDTLPPYPGTARMKTGTSPKSLPEYVPDLLPHEVEVEEEVKDKEEVKGKSGGNGAEGLGASAPAATVKLTKDQAALLDSLRKDISSGRMGIVDAKHILKTEDLLQFLGYVKGVET